MRGETWHLRHIRFQHPVFNPLAPCGARHVSSRVQTGAYNFSIHSPLAGRDGLRWPRWLASIGFSIHSPLAGRDKYRAIIKGEKEFFNPLAPCGARPAGTVVEPFSTTFSIHSPLAGRDFTVNGSTLWPLVFQSTRPLRGETRKRRHGGHRGRFSIHSPLAGRDLWLYISSATSSIFQSTRPLRGETLVDLFILNAHCLFSIHSPLAGRDPHDCLSHAARKVFNPLAPCGARPQHPRGPPVSFRFQSTRPLRGETTPIKPLSKTASFQSTRPLRGETGRPDRTGQSNHGFQSTRPLRGETVCLPGGLVSKNIFNPLAPCGARPRRWRRWRRAAGSFSIHSPLAGRDARVARLVINTSHFQSTRPLRGETSREPLRNGSCHFSIHSPLAGRDHAGIPGRFQDIFSIHSPLAGRDQAKM